MQRTLKRLSHTVYYCRYHIVFCPKYRGKRLTGAIEEYVRNQIYWLSNAKDKTEVIEINIQPDHIHMVVDISPKVSVSNYMGYLKGKTALRTYKRFKPQRSHRWRSSLWSRGYCVSTVGLDEKKIRKYVAWQQAQERKG